MVLASTVGVGWIGDLSNEEGGYEIVLARSSTDRSGNRNRSCRGAGTTWDNLLNRRVVVTYTDGTRAPGTLAAVNSATLSLAQADGSVTASAQSSSTRASRNGGVSSAAANPRSMSQSTDPRASSGATMAMGIRGAKTRYYAGSFYFLGGLGLGLIGVGLSYAIPDVVPPTPAATPGPAHVDVPSHIAGYQKEAEKMAHRSAWAGFATQAAIVTLLVLMVAHGISQSHGILS